MSEAKILCPHCVVVPLAPRTNGFGGAYLECLDCGYYDAIQRTEAPEKDHKVLMMCADGRRRVRIGPNRGHGAGVARANRTKPTRGAA